MQKTTGGEKFSIEPILYGDGSRIGNIEPKDMVWCGSYRTDEETMLFHRIKPGKATLPLREPYKLEVGSLGQITRLLAYWI